MTSVARTRREGGRGSAPGRGHGLRGAPAPAPTRSRRGAARVNRLAVSSLRKARP